MAQNPNEEKARRMVQEADKLASGPMNKLFSTFSFLKEGNYKIDEACQLYVNAGNLFKISKKWDEAGHAFRRCAELRDKQGDHRIHTATGYGEAANCYKKCNAQAAVDCLLKSVDVYSDLGKPAMEGRYLLQAAELYESKELLNLEAAMHTYERAAHVYENDDRRAYRDKCQLKVAQYAAALELYDQALVAYERIGRSAADHRLLKYAAKDYFFRALLCHLAIDFINAQNALTKIGEEFPSFQQTKEYRFIADLILICEEQNGEQYKICVENYNRYVQVEPWILKILHKIKSTICEGEDFR